MNWSSVLLWLLVSLPGFSTPALSQEQVDSTRVTIHGTVVDRASGNPVPEAFVRLMDTDFQARGDSLGRFTLSGLLRGSYYVVVEAPGYEARGGEIRVVRSGELVLPLEAEEVGARAVGQSNQPLSRILGQVVEMETGKAIEGALVSFPTASEERITNGRGRFELDMVEGGTLTLAVSFLGRAPVTDSVVVASGRTVELEIRMAVEPLILDSMVVLATPRNPYLEEMGFFRRQEQGYNVKQISREFIEERDPRSLGDLLLSVPGVRVSYGAAGGAQIRMRRVVRLDSSGESGCVPSVFLDDVPVEVGWLQNIPPSRVEGLEVFSGVNTPIQYNDPCGVILVWTRRGEAGGGT